MTVYAAECRSVGCIVYKDPDAVDIWAAATRPNLTRLADLLEEDPSWANARDDLSMTPLMHIAVEVADSPWHDYQLAEAMHTMCAYGARAWAKSPDTTEDTLLHLLVRHGGYVRHRMEFLCAEMYGHGTQFSNARRIMDQQNRELQTPMDVAVSDAVHVALIEIGTGRYGSYGDHQQAHIY
jgi:hypothetical protein